MIDNPSASRRPNMWPFATRNHPRGRERIAALAPLIRFLERAIRTLPPSVRFRLLPAVRAGRGPVSRAFRYVLLKSTARQCGDVVDVRECVYLLGVQGLSIGSFISIHPMCYLDATGGLEIGDNVSIAHGVTIMSTSHGFSETDRSIREQLVSNRPTFIGDDVWIGAGARILGGSHVGHGSVVAAGAVVTRAHPPMSVLGGVPAKVLRTRESTASGS